MKTTSSLKAVMSLTKEGGVAGGLSEGAGGVTVAVVLVVIVAGGVAGFGEGGPTFVDVSNCVPKVMLLEAGVAPGEGF